MTAEVVFWNTPSLVATFPDEQSSTMNHLDSIVVTEEFPREELPREEFPRECSLSPELPDQQRAFYKTIKQRVNGGKLSDQEIISKLKSFFYQYDDNNDGFITKEEFINALQKSGETEEYAHFITDDLFESLDINKDGKLSTFELVSFLDGDDVEDDLDYEGSECAVEPDCESDEKSGDKALEEPRIPFKKLLDLKQSSATALEILNQTMLSCVWLGLSKNTYGFFIRSMLLCGSHFESQLVPQTIKLLWLSFLGVVVSAGMQFCLAWFLWIRLPQSYPMVDGRNASLKAYPLAGLEDDDRGYSGGRGYYSSPAGCNSPSCMSSSVPLPANEFPNYKFANDICRTDCIIQIICIGLFLFNVLNNVPGLIKNTLIIMQSEKFISEDEEGITKLHYWRQSDFSSEDQSHFLHDYCEEPSAMRVLISGVDSSSHPFIQRDKNGNEISLSISSLESVRIVGLYFSAHWCHPCRIFTPILTEFYNKINSGPDGKVFEVVFVSSDSTQDHFDHYLSEMPWMAIPFANKKVKDVLSKEYNIHGIPTLILLDGATGSLISEDGRAFVMNDPEASLFPWSQKSAVQIALGLLREHRGVESHKLDPNYVVGLFFPQGQGLHGFRKVSVMLKTLVKRGLPFEMIVVPDDSSDEKLLQVDGCFVLPRKNRYLISELHNTFEQSLRQRATCLVLVEGDTGHIISENGLQVAVCDPDGTHYPWKSLNKFSVLLDHCCLSACGRTLNKVPAWTLGSCDTVGLFFVSEECAPCREFAPALARAYNKLKSRGKSFKILMIAKPSDTSEYEIRDCMPADVLFLVDTETRKKLYNIFKVTTTPTLLLCSGETGDVITRHGRINVLLDDECESFPWAGDSPLVSKFCDYLKGSDEGDMKHRFNLQLEPSDYGEMGLISMFTYPLYYFPSKVLGNLCYRESLQKATDFQLTRGCLEVIETRNFISEVLAELNEDSGDKIKPDAETGSVVTDPELPSKSEVQTEEQFRRIVKVKLVRADFLVPFNVTKLGLIQRIQIFLLGIPTLGLLWWALFNRLQACEVLDIQKSKGKSKAHQIKAVTSVPDNVCCDSTCDIKPSNRSRKQGATLDMVLNSVEKKMEADKRGDEVKDFRPLARWGKYPSKMRTLRFIAFCFGVLPEILTLLMITTVGVQYILWSGYKIGSDTQGMEEIILATLAIVFVYDIDESIYDYTLPEMLKSAHEKDKFHVNSWAASEMLRPLKSQTSFHHFKVIFQYQFEYLRWVFGGKTSSSCVPKLEPNLAINTSATVKGKHFLSDCLNDCARLKLSCLKHYAGNDINQLAEKMSLDFDSSMPIHSRRALKMCSKSLGLQRFNDFYLAKQYPFLYAKKFQSFYRTHITESFIRFYSSSGSHFVVLLAISLAIVGAYRTIGHCERFSQDGVLKGSVWSTQNWPNTCMMKVQNSSSKSFSDLSGASADEFMAVSCGLSGYVPDKQEWEQSAKDNFFSDKA